MSHQADSVRKRAKLRHFRPGAAWREHQRWTAGCQCEECKKALDGVFERQDERRAVRIVQHPWSFQMVSV